MSDLLRSLTEVVVAILMFCGCVALFQDRWSLSRRRRLGALALVMLLGSAIIFIINH